VKNHRFMIFLIFLLFIFPMFLNAQTAAELETMLNAGVVTWSQAAKFVFTSANIHMRGNAIEYAAANQWTKQAAPGDPITLAELSFIMMKAFDIKGGLMYSLFPGPRYAYRTMVSRNLIQGASDPALTVSGDKFLLILGKVLNSVGDDK